MLHTLYNLSYITKESLIPGDFCENPTSGSLPSLALAKLVDNYICMYMYVYAQLN
jgi:hypothetical protein